MQLLFCWGNEKYHIYRPQTMFWMFSQVFVCERGGISRSLERLHGRGHMLGYPPSHGTWIPYPHVLDIRPGSLAPLTTSGGHHWTLVTCSFEDLTPSPEWHLVMTTETGTMYGFKVGDTHPTRMLSCICHIFTQKLEYFPHAFLFIFVNCDYTHSQN